MKAEDRARLIKLLGMLGSEHAGEVTNAGRMVDSLVRGLGLTWDNVLAPPDAEPPFEKPYSRKFYDSREATQQRQATRDFGFGWSETRKGGMMAKKGHLRIIVFANMKYGGWSWCVGDDDRTVFGKGKFDTMQEAMDAAEEQAEELAMEL